MNFEVLIGSLPPRVDVAGLIRESVPPRRFSAKRLDDYVPRHPTQEGAATRVAEVGARLTEPASRSSFWSLLRAPRRGAKECSSGGLYLDGGFGVGKTHLLAALWQIAAGPKAYMAFDELMYIIGIAGPAGVADLLAGYRLLAIDEWELDDPGSLKLAIAVLRPILDRRVYVAVTSNTVPLELGAGRLSQKDFQAEIEELAAAFEVVRIEGDDYRRRRFASRPGRRYYLTPEDFAATARQASPGTVVAPFATVLRDLRSVHPIRYRDLARKIEVLLLDDICPIGDLADALRWVHVIDSIYDAGVELRATGEVPLEDLFPAEALDGPFAKKLTRCLSRMEEMLGAPDLMPG